MEGLDNISTENILTETHNEFPNTIMKNVIHTRHARRLIGVK
jgi:hypothetical protein